MKVFKSLVCAVIMLIAKKIKTFRANTEDQKNGAKITIRAKVTQHTKVKC